MTDRDRRTQPATPINDPTWRIALGGVGGDAHSVGLIILRRALERTGFEVRYLSTQNDLETLCAAAADVDAVLVSNMDGHAIYYLSDLRNARLRTDVAKALWYLGGNPALCVDADTVNSFRCLGFDRVFLSYVEPDEVIQQLREDLARRSPARSRPGFDTGTVRFRGRSRSSFAITGQPLDARDDVLGQWHTGADAKDLGRNGNALRAGTSVAAAQ